MANGECRAVNFHECFLYLSLASATPNQLTLNCTHGHPTNLLHDNFFIWSNSLVSDLDLTFDPLFHNVYLKKCINKNLASFRISPDCSLSLLQELNFPPCTAFPSLHPRSILLQFYSWFPENNSFAPLCTLVFFPSGFGWEGFIRNCRFLLGWIWPFSSNSYMWKVSRFLHRPFAPFVPFLFTWLDPMRPNISLLMTMTVNGTAFCHPVQRPGNKLEEIWGHGRATNLFVRILCMTFSYEWNSFIVGRKKSSD